MIRILKNVEVYSPTYMGKKNLLLSNGIIEDVYDGEKYAGLPYRDMEGVYCVPGFIDGHVHVTGGGGEGGFSTRIEEIKAKRLLECGTTGVIGLLGTDSVMRSVESLFAKTMALKSEGLDAYMLVGAYAYPPVTITGNVEKDIIFIEPVIGVGEIAISDKRGSEINVEDLKELAREVYRASLLSGKKAKIVLHVGDSMRKLKPLFESIEGGEVNAELFIPTHVNRSETLLKEGMKWIEKGGYVDLSACLSGEQGFDVVQALKMIKEKNRTLSHVTVSSDAQGSLPVFDGDGNLMSIGISDCSTLFSAFKKSVESGMDIEESLAPFTSNVADIFGLNSGKIERGRKANLLFLTEDLNIKDVMIEGNFISEIQGGVQVV